MSKRKARAVQLPVNPAVSTAHRKVLDRDEGASSGGPPKRRASVALLTALNAKRGTAGRLYDRIGVIEGNN